MIDPDSLPGTPGCYLFKDTANHVLYVGKAKNLKKRVKSYFQKKDLDAKTQVMLANSSSLDFIVTENEGEALVLENTLIKKYYPRYNIRLRDAKTYAYIRLTTDTFPRFVVARRKTGSGTFYGPFVSATERDYILNFLTKTFTLRTCKKMPKKPCLRYHIQLCDAPCSGNISRDEYLKKIAQAKFILTGKTRHLLQKMETDMDQYSHDQHFEKALVLRNQISAITRLNEHQNMQRERGHDEDIINYIIKADTVYLMVFNIAKGIVTTKNEYVFGYNDDFFEEFLLQYYSENRVPPELILPQHISDPLHHFLQTKTERKLAITLPQRGAKKQLLDLIKTNIESAFFAGETKMENLAKHLGLPEVPHVIECFDISHLSGTSTAGSMVQFRNGAPDKNNYRRFKIRTVDTIDDYASIKEIVRRRYTRLKQDDAPYPDLIIIDGGRGHLNGALQELEKIGVKIPIISIAKQEEDIYLPHIPTPLRLPRTNKALHVIQEIRDEAHRFALKYNRLLRRKKVVT
jgi:excinuclease ABC subunit C